MPTLTTLTLPTVMTTGDVARAMTARGYRTPDGRDIRPWMVRRMYELGHVAESVSRVGTYRLVPVGDIPFVLAALRRTGYLDVPPDETW